MRERKVKLEVHIGRDDEGRWWVIASVNDEEALQHGPYEDQATAEKEASSSSLSLKTLRMRKTSGASLGTTCQLGTDDAGARPGRRRGR